jgi:hypothetical protein
MEFDSPEPSLMKRTCEGGLTTYNNAKQPYFSRVCRESREVVFEKGDFLQAMKQFESHQDWDAWNKTRNPWFYPQTDIVHLNWNGA